MSTSYQELDFQETSLGDLMLRRRRMIQLGDLDIYEVKLGDEFLMSSLFHEAEVQLAKLGLGSIEGGGPLDVVVGGLGLGYTAAAALEDSRVSSLLVVELLKPVIKWHQDGLVPLGKNLTQDPRCCFVEGDFFALSSDLEKGFDPRVPGRKHDAILLDIDHTPTFFLNESNARFYTEEGLTEIQTHLKPDGVFALWADGKADARFRERLESVFKTAEMTTVEFPNPLTNGVSYGAIYVARKS